MTAQKVTGKALTDAIIQLAEMLGWRAIHFRPAQTAHGWRTPYQGRYAKGWPDLLLLRDRLVVAEIKGDGDRITMEQQEWLDAFLAADYEAYIWKPADWVNGDIERILVRRKARLRSA